MSTAILLENKYGRSKYIIWANESEICMKRLISRFKDDFYDNSVEGQIIDYIKSRLDKMKISYKVLNLDDLSVAWI